MTVREELRLRGSRVYLTMLVALAVCVVLVALGAWRQGIALLGATLVLGGVMRAFVADTQAGLLRVRSRAFDVVWMVALGAALVTLAIVVPPGI